MNPEVTVEMLVKRGIHTIEDLQRMPNNSCMNGRILETVKHFEIGGPARRGRSRRCSMAVLREEETPSS